MSRQHRRHLKAAAKFAKQRGDLVSPALAQAVYARPHRLSRIRRAIARWFHKHGGGAEVQRGFVAAQRHWLRGEIEESNRSLRRAGLDTWTPSPFLQYGEGALVEHLVEDNAQRSGNNPSYQGLPSNGRTFARSETQWLG